MLFSIDPLFSEAVKKGFDFITPPNDHGYDASVVMVPKKNGDSWRLYYRLDMLSCGLIVCTVRDRAYNNLVAVLTFTDCQHGQIEIERAELYRNGSNYPYRTETNSRYMGKYEKIACYVYGAVMGGMLSIKLPESKETATCDNSPTAPESRPQSATETAETPASDRQHRGHKSPAGSHHARERDGQRGNHARQLARIQKTVRGENRDGQRPRRYTPPRLRECPTTHGTSTSRTNHHPTPQTAATGQNKSQTTRGRQPGTTEKHDFSTRCKNQARKMEQNRVPLFLSRFFKFLIRNLPAGEQDPPPGGIKIRCNWAGEKIFQNFGNMIKYHKHH